jgi:hypothetical protein
MIFVEVSMNKMAGDMPELIQNVREGMTVRDRKGDEIGSVRDVFLGAAGDTTTTDPVGPTSDLGSEVRGDALDALDDRFPNLFGGSGTNATAEEEVLRNRLRREGFVQVDSHGLFQGDRYVLPDQIQSVSENTVHLNVEYSQLIH